MGYFKDPSKVLFFDIESAGLHGHRSSTISIAYQQLTGQPLPGELYARPQAGTFISKWSETQVWKRVLKRQGQIESEKAILEKFLGVLETHTKKEGAVIAGWNIGYEALPQVAGEQRMRGFDIPFLMTRAKKYGLEGKFAGAFGRAKIRDIGAEFAYKIAAEVSTRKEGKYIYEHLVDPKLFEQARSYVKAARIQGYQAGDPVSAQARYLAREGYKFAGWKQESVFKLMGLGEFGAHMAHEDVRAMIDIVQSKRELKGAAFVQQWNEIAVTNKLVSSARFGGQSPKELLLRAQQAGVAPQYRKKLAKELSARGMSAAEYWRLGKMPERWFKVGEGGIGPRPMASLAQRGRGLATAAFDVLRRNKLAVGVGLGIAGLLAVKPLSWISGSDDDYNTIEGMPEGGVAGRMRKLKTDFGSGFKVGLMSGDFISKQTSDEVITKEEFRSFIRKIRAARDQELVLSLLDAASARRSFNRQINWRDPNKAKGIAPYITERGSLGMFGSYQPGGNILQVGGLVDPDDIIAQGLAYSTSPGAVSFLYRALDPKGVEETILHEGLHAVWDEDMAPTHKEAFKTAALYQLREGGGDISALSAKHPVYGKMINRARETKQKAYVDWVANEMFAHRGAAMAYRGLGYQFPENKTLDQIVAGYVNVPRSRPLLSPRIANFDPEDVVNEELGTWDFLKAGIGQHSPMTPPGTGVRFSASELPTTLMDQPIDPRILEFRRDVWDNPEARKAFQARLKQAEKEAQDKLGQLDKTDLFTRDLSRLEGINTQDQSLRAVNLDRFQIDVEDADTLVLKRRGVVNTIKSWFGYGDVSVRLAGIDAPETTSHANDPLGFTRLFQKQPAGEAATSALEQILSEQDDLSLIVNTQRKTYGRYLGVVAGDDDLNINLELLREGAVTALPFGPRSQDILLREQAAAAEESAYMHQRGVWSMARYQAIRVANRYIGRRTTHNVLSRMDKMAANLNLGAYTSFLQEMGSQQRNLSSGEIAQARRMGMSLKRSHGPRPGPTKFSGKDDAYLQIEGLGHSGIAWQKRRMMTDFGSGWLRRIFGGVQQAVTGARARVYAGRELGLGTLRSLRPSALKAFSTTTKTGETFYTGTLLGKGGLGEVYSAYSAKTARKAVYKQVFDPSKEAMPAGGMFLPGGGAGRRAKEAEFLGGTSGLTPQEIKTGKKIFGAALEGSQEITRQAGQRSAVQYEAMMTRKAGRFGAPRVLGETNQGFIQEYAGRAIKTPEEAKGAAEFLRGQLRRQMATPGAPLHLDPHLGQVLVDPKGKFTLADWGFSIQRPDQLSKEMYEGLAETVEFNIKQGLSNFNVKQGGVSILRQAPSARAPIAWKSGLDSASMLRKQMPAISPMPGPVPQVPGLPPAKKPGLKTARQRVKNPAQRMIKWESSHQLAVRQQSSYASNASKGHLHQQGRRKPSQMM